MIRRAPNRWGGGIPLLWNGVDGRDVLQNIRSPKATTFENKAFFEFDSARNGLFHFLKSQGVGAGDKVAIMLFTCDAVTDAVLDLGCEIVFYSCNEFLEKGIIDESKTLPRVVIEQVTFGRRSLDDEILEKYAKAGSIVIRDKALSYGENDLKPQATFTYPTLFSFEASKSITVGWAGILALPSVQQDDFSKYYENLKGVDWLSDLHRNMVLALNALNTRNGSSVKFFFWMLASCLRLRRKSSRSSLEYCRTHSRLGRFTERLLKWSLQSAPEKLKESNLIHNELKNHLETRGFQVVSVVNATNSSPRVTFICENRRQKLLDIFSKREIECGTWFDEPPVDAQQYGLSAADLAVFSRYLNLPCHYTMAPEKVQTIKEAIDEFAH